MTAIGDLRRAGILSALDAEFGRRLAAMSGDSDEDVALAAALASRSSRNGDVCLDLARVAERPWRDADGDAAPEVVLPPVDRWIGRLSASSLVGAGPGATPLVLDGSRLYLRRHWEDERALAAALLRRARTPLDVADPKAFGARLDRLFGAMRRDEPDGQRIAALVAAVSSLTVIVGGPGTGKTSAVVSLLALLLPDLVRGGCSDPGVLLLAPTGKAAARLGEATAAGLGTADSPGHPGLPPATTVHRALGLRRDGSSRFGPGSPLAADLVVVDEASMVDGALMRRLVEAVPPSARLVLLGDPHQLASVEAGAVLADVSAAAGASGYSGDLSRRVARATGEALPVAPGIAASPMGDVLVRLERSHRFSPESAVGRLADAIRRGAADAALAELAGSDRGVRLVAPGARGAWSDALAEIVVTGYAGFAASETPLDALRSLARFRVLAGHRRGPFGLEVLGPAIAAALGARLPSTLAASTTPILVTRSDPALGLSNGDLGIVRRTATGAEAFFTDPGGGLCSVAPARLPPHEPAFAQSVHKSQGSEADRVVVVLPPPGLPLLARELLYTAVTRARESVVIVGAADSVRHAIEHPAERASGLAAALASPER